MKKQILLIIALSLALVLILLPNTIQGSSESDSKIAQASAQTWLDRTTMLSPELSHWKGATAIMTQVYENLEGRVVAYMFGISDGKHIIGHILVGSSEYDYDILEGGTSPPPKIPTPCTVQEAVKLLDLSLESGLANSPAKLLYTGVDGYYALYVIQNQEIAVDLISNKAFLASDLKPSIPSPVQYKENKQATEDSKSPSIILSAGSGFLNMYYWNGNYPSWCGPCSGVSIGAYYRDYRGYGDLYSPDQTMYDYLYYSMLTYIYGGATLPQDYGQGFRSMAWACDYYNFNYANDWTVTGSD
jgi:hypothetical protein